LPGRGPRFRYLQSTFKKRLENPDFPLWEEAKRIDAEIPGFESDADIGAAKRCVIFRTSAKVENERLRIVFLEIGDEEIQQKRLARSRSAQHYGVATSGSEDSGSTGNDGSFETANTLAEMAVAMFAAVERKEKRIVGIVVLRR